MPKRARSAKALGRRKKRRVSAKSSSFKGRAVAKRTSKGKLFRSVVSRKSLIPRVSGRGGYKVSGSKVSAGTGVPAFGNLRATSDGGVVVTHREYICDITSGPNGTPSTFDVKGYTINPGNSGTFPWLSALADSFEQYKLRGMLFQFRSASGASVASSNTSLGNIVMATQYNAAAPAFTNKQQMENYAHGQSGVPSEDIVHEIECQKSQTTATTLYIRGIQVPAGQDPRLYDWGTFYIATQGMQANNVNLGELWCTYVVELIKPRLPDQGTDPAPPVNGTLTDHFSLPGPAGQAITTSHYFGAGGPIGNTQPSTGSSLNGSVGYYSTAGPDLYFIPGYNQTPANQLAIGSVIIVRYEALGSGTTMTASIQFNTGSNWVVGPSILLQNSVNYAAYPVAGTAAQTICAAVATFKKTGTNSVGDYVTVNGGTLPAGTVKADLTIQLVPTTF